MSDIFGAAQARTDFDPRESDVPHPEDQTTLADNRADPATRTSDMLAENPKLTKDPVGARAMLSQPHADGKTTGQASKFVDTMGKVNTHVDDAVNSPNANAVEVWNRVLHPRPETNVVDGEGANPVGAGNGVLPSERKGTGETWLHDQMMADVVEHDKTAKSGKPFSWTGDVLDPMWDSVKGLGEAAFHGSVRAAVTNQELQGAEGNAGYKDAFTTIKHFANNTVNPLQVYKNMAHTVAYFESVAKRKGIAYAVSSLLPYLAVGVATHGAFTGLSSEAAAETVTDLTSQAAAEGEETPALEEAATQARAVEDKSGTPAVEQRPGEPGAPAPEGENPEGEPAAPKPARSLLFRGASAVTNVASKPLAVVSRIAKPLLAPTVDTRMNAMYFAADAGMPNTPDAKLWEETRNGVVINPDGTKENVGVGLEQLLGMPTGGLMDFISDPVDIYTNYLGADPLGAGGKLIGATRTFAGTGGILGHMFGGLGIRDGDDAYRVFTQYQRVRNAVHYMASHGEGQINSTFRGLFLGDAGRVALHELGKASTDDEVIKVFADMADGVGYTHNIAPTLSAYQVMKANYRYGGVTFHVADALAGTADELEAQSKAIEDATGLKVVPLDSAAEAVGSGYQSAQGRFRTIIGNFFSKRLAQREMYFNEALGKMENFDIHTASTQVSNAIGDQLRVLGEGPAKIAVVQDAILNAPLEQRNTIILNAYADTLDALVLSAAKNTVSDQARTFITSDIRKQLSDWMGAAGSGDKGVMASGADGRDVSLTVRDGIEKNSALGETHLATLHFPRLRDMKGYAKGIAELLDQMSPAADGMIGVDAHLSPEALDQKARFADSNLRGISDRLDAKIGTEDARFAHELGGTMGTAYDAKLREISDEMKAALEPIARDDVIGQNSAFVQTYEKVNQNIDVAGRTLNLIDEYLLSSRTLANNPYERRLLLEELNAKLPPGIVSAVEDANPEMAARLRGEVEALKDARTEMDARLARNAIGIEDIKGTLQEHYPKMTPEQIDRLAARVQRLREHNPRFRNGWQAFIDGTNYYQSKIFVPLALYSGGWAIRVGNSEMLLNAFREGGMKFFQDKLITSYAKHETGRAVFTNRLEGFGSRHFGEWFKGSMNDMLHNPDMNYGEKVAAATTRVAGGIILGMRDLAGGTLHGLEGNLIVWNPRTERMFDRVVGALQDYAPGGLPMGVHSSGGIIEDDALKAHMLYGSDETGKASQSIVHRDRSYSGLNPEDKNYYRGLRGVLTRIHDDSFLRPAMRRLNALTASRDLSKTLSREEMDGLQDDMTQAALRDIQARPATQLTNFDRHFAKSKMALPDAEVFEKLTDAQQLRVAAMSEEERATFYNDYDWARSIAYHDLYSVSGVVGTDRFIIHSDLVRQAATGEVKSVADIRDFIDHLPARTEPKNVPTETYTGEGAIASANTMAAKIRESVKAGMQVPQALSNAGFNAFLGPMVNSYVRDPVYMNIFDDEMEKLQPMVDKGLISEDLQKIRGHENAVVKMSKFVHNPMDRTIFESNMRAFAPFYFAQNQAWRRAIRVLHDDPGAFEKYLKMSLAFTNYVAVFGAKQGGFITLPGTQFMGALAGKGNGLSQDQLGGLSFNLSASVGSVSSVIPTGSEAGLGVLETMTRPSWGPLVTLSLKGSEGIFGLLHKEYADKYVNGVLGPIAAQSSIEDELAPSSFLRNIEATGEAAFNNGNSSYASVQNYVLTNALENKFNQFYDTAKTEAIKLGLPEKQAAQLANATALRELPKFMYVKTNGAQVHEFMDQVHAAGVILYAAKTALGFVSPLSLSINEAFSKNADLQKLLTEKLPDGKLKYTYNEATALFVERYPDQVISLVAHSQSAGSEYPETKSALALLEHNPYAARTYPNAAAFLTDFGGNYSYPAFQMEISMHLRSRYNLSGGDNGFGPYYDAVMQAIGDSYYYNVLEKRYPQSEGESGYSNYKALLAAADEYGNHENPTWNEYFNGGKGGEVAVRSQAISQMETMLTDPNVPDSVYGGANGKTYYEAMLAMYNTRVAEYQAAPTSTAKYNIEEKWYTSMTNLANSGEVSPSLSYFITSVLRNLPTKETP